MKRGTITAESDTLAAHGIKKFNPRILKFNFRCGMTQYTPFRIEDKG